MGGSHTIKVIRKAFCSGQRPPTRRAPVSSCRDTKDILEMFVPSTRVFQPVQQVTASATLYSSITSIPLVAPSNPPICSLQSMYLAGISKRKISLSPVLQVKAASVAREKLRPVRSAPELKVGREVSKAQPEVSRYATH
jgi:hypothetical protein